MLSIFYEKLNPEINLFGLARNEEDGKILEAKGVTPRIGDYTDKNSLVKAFEGIDRLLFVSVPNHDLQKNVVEAIKESSIKFVAYTSINGIEYSKLGLEINHKQTEELIKNTGVAHTFLRNSWYLDLDRDLVLSAGKTGKFYYTANGGVNSWALKSEYAEAGARVILADNNPEIVHLSRTPHSYLELADAIVEATGKTLEIKQVDEAEFEKFITEADIQGAYLALAKMMQTYVQNGNNGEENNTPTDFERILGRKLAPLSQIVKEYLKENGIV
ncbi:MAG: NAD(P)H-binding protein [Capnocytophaga sp.]|nr:NAD(P)H-binding protein [Capnocytophaga sp.]